VLGHEFADDDGEIRDGPDHQHIGERLCDPGRHAPALKDAVEAFAQGRTRECARQDADQGDADLDGGEKAAWIFGQREGSSRPLSARVAHHLEAGLAGGDNSEFGEGEEAVETNQN
jgi:hypothetical protein